MFVLFSRDQN